MATKVFIALSGGFYDLRIADGANREFSREFFEYDVENGISR